MPCSSSLGDVWGDVEGDVEREVGGDVAADEDAEVEGGVRSWRERESGLRPSSTLFAHGRGSSVPASVQGFGCKACECGVCEYRGRNRRVHQCWGQTFM